MFDNISCNATGMCISADCQRRQRPRIAGEKCVPACFAPSVNGPSIGSHALLRAGPGPITAQFHTSFTHLGRRGTQRAGPGLLAPFPWPRQCTGVFPEPPLPAAPKPSMWDHSTAAGGAAERERDSLVLHPALPPLSPLPCVCLQEPPHFHVQAT